MSFTALSSPSPRIVATLGVVLGLLSLAQIIAPAAPTAPIEPRDVPSAQSLTIAQPLGSRTPPPPTMKGAIPADPFRQLNRIGLDGYALRTTAVDLGVDITPVSAIDLTGIDLTHIDAQDRKCLTEAIYHEARNQDLAGQMAVADVVLNRVAHSRYPNTICGVVYEGSSRSTGCQFTFTCDGSLAKRIERRPMVRSQILATAILGGFRLPLSAEATNYHAGYVSPYWAPTLDKTTQIGDHVFYKRGVKFETYLRNGAAPTSG